MENQPLVSIIVPVYNTEKYLNHCLTSIVNQTYRNLEILLVNDGSTDGSEAVCRQFMARDPRIQLFCQENQGQSAARNLGLDHMTGQYLMFVDSDDYIDLSMVEILLDRMLTYQVEAASTLTPATPLEAVSGKVMSRDQVFDVMMCAKNLVGQPCRIRYLILPSKLYLAEIFQALRLPVGRVCEDEYMFHQIYDQVEQIYCVNESLYHYVQTQNSTMRRNGVLHFPKDGNWALTERLKYFQGYGVPKYVRSAAHHLLSHTKQFYEQMGTSPQEVAQHLQETMAEIKRITGRTFFNPYCFFYALSPSIYCRLRSFYRKLRGRG